MLTSSPWKRYVTFELPYSTPIENTGAEETIMSNLSELFDDLTSTFVDELVEDELELAVGVYKYTVSHFEITNLSHPVRNT